MSAKGLRAWSRFVADVQRGLSARGLAIDFFGFHDLRRLFEAKNSPAMVVEHAEQLRARGSMKTLEGIPEFYETDMEWETGENVVEPFRVGDTVNVLSAFRLPKFEVVIHTGTIRQITYDAPSGPLYWISGLAVARSRHVLRATT